MEKDKQQNQKTTGNNATCETRTQISIIETMEALTNNQRSCYDENIKMVSSTPRTGKHRQPRKTEHKMTEVLMNLQSANIAEQVTVVPLKRLRWLKRQQTLPKWYHDETS